VLADAVPRRTDLDDVDMPIGDVRLDLQLVPQMFRHALACPSLNSLKVCVGHRRHVVTVATAALGSASYTRSSRAFRDRRKVRHAALRI